MLERGNNEFVSFLENLFPRSHFFSRASLAVWEEPTPCLTFIIIPVSHTPDTIAVNTSCFWVRALQNSSRRINTQPVTRNFTQQQQQQRQQRRQHGRCSLSLSLSLCLALFLVSLLQTKTTDSQAKKHPIGHTWGWPHTQPERQK